MKNLKSKIKQIVGGIPSHSLVLFVLLSAICGIALTVRGIALTVRNIALTVRGIALTVRGIALTVCIIILCLTVCGNYIASAREEPVLREPVAVGYVTGLPNNSWLLMFEKLDGRFNVVRRLKQGEKIEILRLDLPTKTDPFARRFHEIRAGSAEGFVDKTYIYSVDGESSSAAESTPHAQESSSAAESIPHAEESSSAAESTPHAQESTSPSPSATNSPTPTKSALPSTVIYGRISGIPEGMQLQAFTALDGQWELAFQAPNTARVGIIEAFVKTEFDSHTFHLIAFQGQTGYVMSDFIEIE